MKDFFFFSSSAYTIGFLIFIFAVITSPDSGGNSSPATTPEIAAGVGVFIISIIALTGYCFGLWDMYVEKKKNKKEEHLTN